MLVELDDRFRALVTHVQGQAVPVDSTRSERRYSATRYGVA